MRIKTLITLTSVLALPAFAQVQISVQLPTITFNAPPPMVVIEPGVQVVEDNDEEVFFVSNHYWVRRGPRWYRARDHRGGWVVVDGPGVPPSLVRVPAGKYRRYKRGKTVVIDDRRRDDDRDDDDKGKKKGKHKGGKH